MRQMRHARSANGRIIGKMGHASATYRKHPAILHNRKLEATRTSKRVKAIANPAPSVRDLLNRRT